MLIRQDKRFQAGQTIFLFGWLTERPGGTSRRDPGGVAWGIADSLPQDTLIARTANGPAFRNGGGVAGRVSRGVASPSQRMCATGKRRQSGDDGILDWDRGVTGDVTQRSQ